MMSVLVFRILAALLVAFGSPLCCCQAGMMAGAAVCVSENPLTISEPAVGCCGGCTSDWEQAPATADDRDPASCESCAACEGTSAGSGITPSMRVSVDDTGMHAAEIFRLLERWYPRAWSPERSTIQVHATEHPRFESGRAVLRWQCALTV